MSHCYVGSEDAIGYLAPLVSVYAPRAAVAWRGATPEARLNMEGMENIGFKARSACGWGLRREALKVGTQRDALWQRKLCGLVWQPAGLAWQACYVDGNLK